jgi:uncharacterized protein YbjT (DUF2867 family)
MKILLTGVTGYIGKRLLPLLVQDGHQVICLVRDKKRFNYSEQDHPGVVIIEADFLDKITLESIPKDIDAAFYLIHSMSASTDDFEKLEETTALNFREALSQTLVKQVIYLSGIVNEEKLSRHLSSRKNVENILADGDYHLTTLRAGIIVGSGSASFEIIRDLVEKLPIMIAPKWLNTRSQPISIRNVIQYLQGVLLNEKTFGRSFDIGGPDILTYKEMLLQFAEVRKLKRTIITVPVMTPKLSSYWLYFVTSTTYKLAVNLVNSMKVEVVCKDHDILDIIKIDLIPFKQAVESAFNKIELKNVFSSWTDALTSEVLQQGISNLLQVPSYGCYKDQKVVPVKDEEATRARIWSIGGENGWYYANFLWKLRGFLDKLAGGVGLRRGRKNPVEIQPGDSLDFWRVLYANKKDTRLLLYAEMKLPGEAWLEFTVKNSQVYQTATFRPRGVLGRLYWYAALPLHWFVFNGMIKKIAS